jgi:PAS domain S-box-containing protein
MDPVLDSRSPLLLFLGSTMIAARYAGFGPALLALVLGYFSADYFFLDPRGHFGVREPVLRASVEIYFAVGLAIVFLAESLRKAKRQAEVNAQVALQRQQELERADQAVRTQAAWLELTLADLGDAVIATDIAGNVTSLNHRAEDLTGWESTAARGQPLCLILTILDEATREPVIMLSGHPSQVGTNRDSINPAVLVRKDGVEHFVTHSVIPLKNAIGELAGMAIVCRDVTEHRRAEVALAESEARLRQFMEHIDDVFWLDDAHADRVLYASPAYETVWGRQLAHLYRDSKDWFKAIHPQDRDRVARNFLAKMKAGQHYHTEYRIIRPDGSLRWIRDRGFPIRNESGEVYRVVGCAEDITERKRTEFALHFLAKASASLAALKDHEATLQNVADLAVPDFADWCLVGLMDERGGFRGVVSAHRDPAKRALVQELAKYFPPRFETSFGIRHVLQTGRPDLVPDISDSMLVTLANDEEQLRCLRELGLKSCMCVPVKVQNKTIAVFTFVSAESNRRYNAGDLEVAKDLARRIGIAIENAQLYEQLQEADRRKQEFLAMMAHELRNPLAPIRNALYILGQPDADASTREESREVIERQVNHLVRLVDDLLDVSRVLCGKIEIRKEPVELAAVVKHALETARPAIVEQRHELTVSIPPEPIWLEADPIRLAQVIFNLLQNAAKYTEPRGNIWLTAERAGDEAVIRVRDNGTGIAPEMLPRVFDLFMQADNTLARSQGGLGLGLPLVRSLVEMHDGSVVARSAGLGQGSEFIVRLPTLSQERWPQPHKVERPLWEAPPSMHCRVLVVEDNIGAAKILSRLLTRFWGHEVAMVHDGLAALQAAREFHPDMVLLDIGLPGISGYEVARQLRAEPEFQDTLLVALSGYGTAEDQQRSREAGIDVHLIKPPAVTDLQKLFVHPKLLAHRRQ